VIDSPRPMRADSLCLAGDARDAAPEGLQECVRPSFEAAWRGGDRLPDPCHRKDRGVAEAAAPSSGYGSSPVATGGRGRPLSRREMEIVCLLSEGDRVPLIARQLWLTQGTVRNHLHSIYRKLGVKSQQELIVLLRDTPQPRQRSPDAGH
jgi:DNA-binding CsgD family transcriptional regulator